MAKRNQFSYEKRQREIRKKKKAEEKREQKRLRREAAADGEPAPAGEARDEAPDEKAPEADADAE